MGMSSLEVQSTQDGSFCTLPAASTADASLPVKWASLDTGTWKPWISCWIQRFVAALLAAAQCLSMKKTLINVLSKMESFPWCFLNPKCHEGWTAVAQGCPYSAACLIIRNGRLCFLEQRLCSPNWGNSLAGNTRGSQGSFNYSSSWN